MLREVEKLARSSCRTSVLHLIRVDGKRPCFRCSNYVVSYFLFVVVLDFLFNESVVEAAREIVSVKDC